MPWYLEFNDYPADSSLLPERKSIRIECPDDISCHSQAKQMAKEILEKNQSLKREHPLLVWKEKII